MTLVIDDQLEKEFREAVYTKMGMKKGNIKIAIEGAMKDWIVKQK
jgi:hypothetical protein